MTTSWFWMGWNQQPVKKLRAFPVYHFQWQSCDTGSEWPAQVQQYLAALRLVFPVKVNANDSPLGCSMLQTNFWEALICACHKWWLHFGGSSSKWLIIRMIWCSFQRDAKTESWNSSGRRHVGLLFEFQLFLWGGQEEKKKEKKKDKKLGLVGGWILWFMVDKQI